MLEMLALGFAQLTDARVLNPERRRELPKIEFAMPAPVVQVNNLNHSLFVLRDAAWKALDQVKTNE